MNDLDETVSTVDAETIRLAALMSIVALVLSVWTAALSVDDESTLQRMQARLACLELPGPNDCAVDDR